MGPLSTYNLQRWIQENGGLFAPPVRTNRVLMAGEEFIVMVLRGPNERLDFHLEPGDELLYQIEGEIELHLMPADERRQVVKIGPGELFLCPGGVPHSPRRGNGTWGLVIERRRRPEEMEEFLWFCEQCDTKVYSQAIRQGNVTEQVARVYEAFNREPQLRTCPKCSYVFPPTPLAERLGFLD